MSVNPAKKNNVNNGKENLVDSSLERIDPTPNIHDLFRQFNCRFFWSKLDMVEVAWSGKQMTSCAGVCSFRPRSGDCRIRLSAPLLSLRPRKDLVETLLHEMIHAYLFITRNYKDRSDHGPEFHKHMYRINKEAGTNITVFHTFNDEVRHFQNHVWRCNGPCQKVSPYFGIVRRSQNRAPGPNDFWWDKHRQMCSGTYEKIEEPPGYKSKKKGVQPIGKGMPNGSKDIRNFFNTPRSLGTNVHTLNDLSKPSGQISGRINTFGKGNVLKNTGSGTMVVQGKTAVAGGKPVSTSTPQKKNFVSTSTPKTKNTIFSSTPIKSGERVNEQVRNIWANKYPEKRKNEDEVNRGSDFGPPESKIKRENAPCTSSSVNVIKQCERCDNFVEECELLKHRATCQPVAYVPPDEGEDWLGRCPICDIAIEKGQLENHLNSCLSDSIMEDRECGDEEEKADVNEKANGSTQLVFCPVCNHPVAADDVNRHIDECLNLYSLSQAFSP